MITENHNYSTCYSDSPFKQTNVDHYLTESDFRAHFLNIWISNIIYIQNNAQYFVKFAIEMYFSLLISPII